MGAERKWRRLSNLSYHWSTFGIVQFAQAEHTEAEDELHSRKKDVEVETARTL